MHASLAADGVDGHNVGMVQLGGCLGLMIEAGDLLLVQQGGERQNFQGNFAAQRDLPRFVDHAHPAAGDLGQDAIIAETLMGRLQGANCSLTPWEATAA